MVAGYSCGSSTGGPRVFGDECGNGSCNKEPVCARHSETFRRAGRFLIGATLRRSWHTWGRMLHFGFGWQYVIEVCLTASRWDVKMLRHSLFDTPCTRLERHRKTSMA